MTPDDNQLGSFFDALSDDYTATIERCFPRYREMLWALLEYLPPGRRFPSVLELGCGTGNLSVLLSERLPDAALRLVDISAESLDVCRQRLGERDGYAFTCRDFRELSFEPARFDLVVSSIAIHHVPAGDKRRLFQKVHGWLKPGGVFAFADQFRGATDDLYARHIAQWKRESLAAGATEAEFAMWMEHQRDHDHHDPLKPQLDWLVELDFTDVDCPWRYLLWAVVQARKP